MCFVADVPTFRAATRAAPARTLRRAVFDGKTISEEEFNRLNTREVVVTTIETGDGTTFPQDGDMVSVIFTSKLKKGAKEFDSSKGKPFEFQVMRGHAIRGWELGVMKMSVGEKATLDIPSHLGWGQRGSYGKPDQDGWEIDSSRPCSGFGGGVVPKDADLLYEVQLLAIK